MNSANRDQHDAANGVRVWVRKVHMHGGKKPGSAGCIDIGGRDVDLFPKLQQLTDPLDVIVVYPTDIYE